MNERLYIARRLLKAKLQCLYFYANRIYPVKPRKIVFTTIEGTTGYMCNPKYIAEELLRRDRGYELVWLTDDLSHSFPHGIRAVKNTLRNRARELSTARFWIDDSRKQLECRKRKGQIYLQTWHAQLAIKPVGLQRGAAFSRIAYLVSRHDSDMIDYFTSNSAWFTNQLPEGQLYCGKVLKVGSCRCDVLINCRQEKRRELRQRFGLKEDAKLLMYCPTFRSGSQGTKRSVDMGDAGLDFPRLLEALETRFGGEWVILLRLHPQLTARQIVFPLPEEQKRRVIDISREDDMYELLAGCDAFLSDYSAASFDAAVMRIPVFLLMRDYADYVADRGKLMWTPEQLVFPCAADEEALRKNILAFDAQAYRRGLEDFFAAVELLEDGRASARVVDFIEKMT